MNVTNTKTFVEKANKIHCGIYDYSRANYVNKRTKVKIICPQHGYFLLTPEEHTAGKQARGCPKCSISVWAMTKRKTQSDYIKGARLAHGDKYCYDKVIYLGKRAKICIVCRTHGDFWQNAQNHLHGNGCPRCAFANKYTNESFAEKANQIHMDKYDYSKSVFTGALDYITIICRKHGDFRQTAASHLSGCGCPKCNASSGERMVESVLKHTGEQYETQKRFSNCRGVENGVWGEKRQLAFDFYLPKRNILIEYDGKHHFQPIPFGSDNPEIDFEKQKIRDRIKEEFALKNGFTLIRIPFHVLREYGFSGLSDYLLKRLNPKEMAKLL